MLLVIVNDLDIVRIGTCPSEADPPLVVDADAVLPGTRSLELLKPVRRRHSEVVQVSRPVDHVQFPQRDSLNVPRQLARDSALPDQLGLAVAKGLDHQVQ